MASKVKPQENKVIDGVTVKYHADGKSIFAKGKMKDGKPERYWEWFRKDGTLKRSGILKMESLLENGQLMIKTVKCTR